MNEETIFTAALEKEDPTERAAYLDEACADSPAMRERVEALLRSHTDQDSFLDVPAVARQAAGEDDDPNRTTSPPATDEKGDSKGQLPTGAGRLEAEPTPGEEALTFLAPAREAGSLGRLDHYEVLEVVGRGGMGVVFKARDTKLQRIVAIKVLAPQLAAKGTARKRFVREAQAGAAIRDEHVVSIHAVSDDGAVPYLVMEFIGAVTLAERVKQGGPLEVKEVLRIGLQAAKGLAAAHAQGLIHRDVTPGNILLENGVQRVKLTDFGLARAMDDASLTQAGVIAGTPLYMSPEQARGESLDVRSDLFSLGSVLYTLCTGRPAFPASNTMAVLKRVCDDAPKPIREVNPDIPDWLAAVVNKLLAKEARDRFSSAAELAELLGQHLAQLQHPSLTPPQPPAALQPKPASPTRQKRYGMTAVVVGLVGVAACLVAVAFLSRAWLFPSRDDRPESSTPLTKKETPLPLDDPRVLTVSQKSEGGGRFRTISEALDQVEPGMTIRILDDAVYEEHLRIDRPEKHRGVVLEAAGKASIRHLAQRDEIVWIRGETGCTLRGLSFVGSPGNRVFVRVSGPCLGVVLDRLDLTANGCDCIYLHEVPPAGKDATVVIQNCTMRGGYHGVYLEGRAQGNFDRPQPCGGVVIRNNTLVGCGQSVFLAGAIMSVQVVGNRILDSKFAAIDLADHLPGTADILIANNTLLQNKTALRLWDDHAKGKAFLECKNIRVQNNLVLEPQLEADLLFQDHPRGDFNQARAPDLSALQLSPEWRFNHNWREIIPLTPESRFWGRWIPKCPQDRLQVPIEAGSRKPDAPDFLRPPKDSPLATAGAGVDDKSLPPYVGAVPPEGVTPWDWEKTWKVLAR